jgi:hypothetical protein
MPITRKTYVGGIDTANLGKVQLNWGGLLPIPGEEASPRQVLDFAAIVGLDASSNSAQAPMLVQRALAAYEALYGVSSVAIRAGE